MELFGARSQHSLSILIFPHRLWLGYWRKEDDRWLLYSASNQSCEQTLVYDGIVYNLYHICVGVEQFLRQSKLFANTCVIGVSGEGHYELWQEFQALLISKNISIPIVQSSLLGTELFVQGIEHLVAEKCSLDDYIQYRNEICISAQLLHMKKEEESI